MAWPGFPMRWFRRRTGPGKVRRESEAFLRRHGLPPTPRLPLVEAIADLSPPSAREVAARSLVLSYLTGLGYGVRGQRIEESLRARGLWEHVSPRERAELARGMPTPQAAIDARWLAECVQVLAWGLGLVALDPFRRCDDDLASHFPRPDRSPEEFLAAARLRPFPDIYRQLDLHYLLHWEARDAGLRGYVTRLDREVLQERDRAIRWMAGVERDWDEISTDT